MNLIVNPGFQTGDLTGWSSNPPAAVVTGGVPFGTPPYFCCRLGPSVGSSALIIQNTPSLTAGVTYYFSFWILNDSFSTFTTVNAGGYIIESVTSNPLDGWTFKSYTFVPGVSGPISLSFSQSFPAPGPTYLDDIWLSTTAVCYPRGTKICVADEILSSRYVDVVDLRAGEDRVLTVEGSPMDIVKVVRCGKVNRLVEFERGSLGEDLPFQTLQLTTGHKLPLDGEEVKAGQHPLGKIIKTRDCFVYTVILRERCLILAFGAPIVGMSLEEWEKIADHCTHTEL